MDFLLNTVTFSLPCRSFKVDYTVSKKRQLPVVKEFVLRYLYLVGDTKITQLCHYFGFSENEASIVLNELQSENLIELNDSIALNKNALENFSGDPSDHELTLFEISDELTNVIFDLKNFRLVSHSTSGKKNRFSIDLPLPDEAYVNQHQKAESAFNNHFRAFLRSNASSTDDNATELYKINDILPENEKTIPLRLNLIIDSSDPSHPILEYEDDWLNDWDHDYSIASFVSKRLSNNVGIASVDLNEIQAFSDIVELPSLLDCKIKDGLFDPSSLLSNVIEPYQSNGRFTQILGNLYLESNSDRFFDLINQSIDLDRLKLDLHGAIWISNSNVSNSLWGKDYSYSDFASRLQNIFNKSFKPTIVLATKTTRASDAFKIRTELNTDGITLQGTNSYFYGSNTEWLLIPNVIAVGIIHLPVDGFGNQLIPVGVMSTENGFVTKIHELMNKWFDQPDIPNTYFERPESNKNQHAFQKNIIKILSD